ncbi:MAG: HD domain-containing phosphohydrolase [Bdellovibrionales bacterium]
MSAKPPDYIPIRLGTLRDGSVATFDIYIPLSDHYVHYIKLSDTIDLERINKLKAKGSKKLYIPKAQETDYLNYLDEGLSQIGHPSVPPEKNAEIANAALVTMSESIKSTIESEKSYQRTQKQLEKITDFLQSDKTAVRQMISEVGMSEDIHQHCATVSSLAISLADTFDIKDTKHLLELGTAALLHDVGLMNLSFDPMTPKSQMTAEQLAEYEKHPEMAKEILGKKRYISPNILQLILDHERDAASMKKLNLLSQILNICNHYDRYCRERKLTLSAASEMYLIDNTDHMDGRLLRGLYQLVKGQP